MGIVFSGDEWQPDDDDGTGPISRSLSSKAREGRTAYDDFDGGPIGFIISQKAKEAALEREHEERRWGGPERSPSGPDRSSGGPERPSSAPVEAMGEQYWARYVEGWPSCLGGRERRTLPEDDLDVVIGEYFGKKLTAR